MNKHTPGSWHVNAIDSKRKRVTGDETSEGWDKLQINAANCTVATVYRAKDARLIAAAPALLEALEAFWTLCLNDSVRDAYHGKASFDDLMDSAEELIKQARGES